uniref:ligand-gated cation channel ZACN-like n=1 Tax=Myxine glutinosa TaxID=7769 RepID=UPI00358E46F4
MAEPKRDIKALEKDIEFDHKPSKEVTTVCDEVTRLEKRGKSEPEQSQAGRNPGACGRSFVRCAKVNGASVKKRCMKENGARVRKKSAPEREYDTETECESECTSECESSVRLMVHRDKMQTRISAELPCKVQILQELKTNYRPKRKAFAMEVLSRIEDDKDYMKKVMFRDEACLDVSGKVNRHNSGGGMRSAISFSLVDVCALACVQPGGPVEVCALACVQPGGDISFWAEQIMSLIISIKDWHEKNPSTQGKNKVRNPEGVYIVLFSTLLQDIKEQLFGAIFTVSQSWVDSRLAWDENTFPLKEISLRVSDLWTPDLVALETKEESKLPTFDNVVVGSNGNVSYHRFIKVLSNCKMIVYLYPFDQHDCRVTFVSSYSVNAMKLKLHEFNQTFSNKQSDEFIVTFLTCKENTNFTFASFSCYVVFHQTYVIALMSFMIPYYLIIILDTATCFLPLWGDVSVDRLSAKLTLLLTFNFILFTLSENIPGNINGCVPIIVQVFMAALFFLALNLLETIFIIFYCSRKSCPSMLSCLWKCLSISGKSGLKSNVVEDNEKGESANDKDMEARRMKSRQAKAEIADRIFFWIYLILSSVFFIYMTYIWQKSMCMNQISPYLTPLEPHW